MYENDVDRTKNIEPRSLIHLIIIPKWIKAINWTCYKYTAENTERKWEREKKWWRYQDTHYIPYGLYGFTGSSSLPPRSYLMLRIEFKLHKCYKIYTTNLTFSNMPKKRREIFDFIERMIWLMNLTCTTSDQKQNPLRFINKIRNMRGGNWISVSLAQALPSFFFSFLFRKNVLVNVVIIEEINVMLNVKKKSLFFDCNSPIPFHGMTFVYLYRC